MKNNFLQTPSKPGVLQGKTFSHTPDEARSVGLAKDCVFQKIYSVIEKLDPRILWDVRPHIWYKCITKYVVKGSNYPNSRK